MLSKKEIKMLTAEDNVHIFTKDYCIYCDAAKELLEDLSVPFSEESIQTYKDNYAEDNEKVTAPRIFINGVLIGGYTELKAIVVNASTS